MSYEEIDFTNAEMLRQKADERLKERQEKDIQVIDADMKKIMHELQVHQNIAS